MSQVTGRPSASESRGFEVRRRRGWVVAVIGLAALAAVVAGVVLLRGGDSDASAPFGKDLSVAYLSTDGAQQAFLDYVAEEVAPDYGVTIDPRGIGDPNQLHAAVDSGEIAATVYAHAPWIAQSNASNGWHVDPIEPVFQWAYSLWSSKYDSFDALPDGARIAVLDDPANMAQALLLLSNDEKITLDPDVDPAQATLEDIAANPRHFEFKPIAFGTAARSLDDFDGIISYNFEFTAADTPVEDKIYAPEAPRVFAAQLAVSDAHRDDPNVATLAKVFADPRVAEYLKSTGDPAVAGQLTPVSAK